LTQPERDTHAIGGHIIRKREKSASARAKKGQRRELRLTAGLKAIRLRSEKLQCRARFAKLRRRLVMTTSLIPPAICQSCKTELSSGAKFCPQCGKKISDASQTNQDPYLGMVISERYRLESLIGIGASGRVYRAGQISIGKAFAVKMLKPEFSHDPNWRQRFANEAKNTAKLNHPNVVSVVDYGVIDSGPSYLVMEFIEGRPLDAIIREDFPLPASRIIDLTLQILGALTEAHDLKIVHRDLKPENILVQQLRTHGEHVKILDFGIATLLEANAYAITLSEDHAILCGTPEYMSPEQTRGAEVDARSDLYAVGIILYEMLTGTVPFSSSSPMETLRMQLEETPKRPSERVERDLGLLEDICLRALAKDPRNRYEHAHAFREAILAASHVDQKKGRRCPQCRHGAYDHDVFCVRCGYRLPQEGASTHQEVSTSGKERVRRGSTQEHLVGSLPVLPVSWPVTCVGREREVASIIDFFTTESPHVRTFSIEGESGMGITRMLAEVSLALNRLGWVVYSIGSEASGFSPPMWPIRALVADILELDLDTVTSRELGRANNLLGGTIEALPGLAQLFNLGGPIAEAELAVRRRECLASIVECLTAAGRGSPVLLVFDDVHDFDHASKATLERLCRAQAAGPVAILFGTRSRLLAPTTQGHLSLHGLQRTEIEAVVELALGANSPPRWLQNLREGETLSPLQISILVHLQANLAVEQVEPPTELARRWLGSLNTDASYLVQCASVCGRTFLIEDLRVLYVAGRSAHAASGFEAALGLAEASGLLIARRHDIYEFPNRAILDVAYAMLEAPRRSFLHAQAASRTEASLRDVHVRALHLLRAGTTDCIDALVENAEVAASRFDDFTAVELLRASLRACDLPANASDSGRRIDVVCRLANALMYADGGDQAVRLLEQERQRVRAIPMLHARVSKLLGRVLLRRNDPSGAVRMLRSAMAVASARGLRHDLLDIYTDLGRALGNAGDPKQGLQEMLEGLDLCTLGEGPRAPVDVDLWRYLTEVASLMAQVGRLREARMWCEHALFQAERRARPLGIMRATVMLAWLTKEVAQPVLSEQYRASALEKARHLGDRKTTAELLIERGKLRIHDGELEEAEHCLLEAHSLASVIEWEEGLAQIDAELALLHGHRSTEEPISQRTG
jgi:serine/threonine-protein kinase